MSMRLETPDQPVEDKAPPAVPMLGFWFNKSSPFRRGWRCQRVLPLTFIAATLVKSLSMTCICAFMMASILFVGCRTTQSSGEVASTESSRTVFASMIWPSHIRGEDFHSVVDLKQLQAAPQWDARDRKPPLSFKAAKRVALAKLRETVTDAEEWTLVEINLNQPFARSEGIPKGFWIYMFQFQRAADSAKPPEADMSYVRIVVLMNGEALPLSPSQRS